MKYRIVATICIVFGLAMLMVDQAALAWLSFAGLIFPAIGYASDKGGLRG